MYLVNCASGPWFLTERSRELFEAVSDFEQPFWRSGRWTCAVAGAVAWYWSDATPSNWGHVLEQARSGGERSRSWWWKPTKLKPGHWGRGRLDRGGIRRMTLEGAEGDEIQNDNQFYTHTQTSKKSLKENPVPITLLRSSQWGPCASNLAMQKLAATDWHYCEVLRIGICGHNSLYH